MSPRETLHDTATPALVLPAHRFPSLLFPSPLCFPLLSPPSLCLQAFLSDGLKTSYALLLVQGPLAKLLLYLRLAQTTCRLFPLFRDSLTYSLIHQPHLLTGCNSTNLSLAQKFLLLAVVYSL